MPSLKIQKWKYNSSVDVQGPHYGDKTLVGSEGVRELIIYIYIGLSASPSVGRYVGLP